jgi:hypothetical protein
MVVPRNWDSQRSYQAIKPFEQAGCTVKLVANTEHMIACDNLDGLAAA